jgi:hypothetical protein
MTKSAPAFMSFNRGEFSPLLGAVINLDVRKDAVKEMQNLIPLKQGPATRRGGTKYICEVKDSSKTTRLVPFEFSTVQAYQLEFGENYVRFFKDYGAVTNTAQNITAVTKANPAVVTYSGTDTFANGDQVYINGVAGMTELNGRRFTVANVNTGANTFELSGINSTAYTTYISGGTIAEPYEVATTYTQAQIPDLRFVQSADVLYIAHQAHPIRALTRTGHTSWTLTDISLLDGPYLVENQLSTGAFATSATITPSATTGSGVTLTASTAMFAATDVGRLVRLKHSSTWGWATITAYTSSTQVTATVTDAFGATTAATAWRLGLYSATTGYPRCIRFFQDRFVAAGPTSFPQKVSFGQVGQYTATSITFKPTATDGVVADDNGFDRTIPSGSVNEIRWIGEDPRGLLVGTSAGEWVISSGQISGSLAPDDAYQKEISLVGSIAHQPAKINNVTIFAQARGRKLYQVAYSLSDDNLLSTDLSVMSEHITRSGIKEMAYQQEPINVVWMALNNGRLIGMTFLPEQKVIGWHKHIIGGTSAAVKSISSIPSPDDGKDDLWLIVSRTINGGTKQYVEYMASYYDADDTAQEDAVVVDSALIYDGASATTITGLWHLEGQTLKLLVNGAAHPDVVVTNGTITLEVAATTVVAGLKNIWKLITLELEAGARLGTAQGKTKRITNIVVRLLNTLGLRYGSGDIDFEDLEEYQDADEEIFDYGLQMGTATPLFSGDKKLPYPDGYNTHGTIQLGHDGAFPATILGIFPDATTEEGQ